MRSVDRLGQFVALIVAGALLGTIGGVSIASASTGSDVMATYNGGTIDLSQGWGTATVCAVSNYGTNCFANKSDYESWISINTGLGGVQPLINCSSGLQLYQNVSYGGNELVLFQKAAWINLSSYSFSDEVSSYKVGACSISMTDGQNGSGNVYPGATSAGSDVSWIGTAWNDRVQSVYIY
jgi:hypothetical protein